uniref:Kinetochore protein Spc24 n=1 Tax=Takifugu rubripes TaxID=31033 RepID=A0A674P524_TAKRU
MAQGHKFQDLEETGEALVAFINSSQPEKLKQVKKEHQALSERHIETKKIVTQILKGTFLDSVTSISLVQYMIIQFVYVSFFTRRICYSFRFLQGELENLRNAEHEIQTLQSEVDEDTTEVIPSAVYVAQLFYLITKIKWEYDTQPNILKGVHYGEDLATPINIDSSLQDESEISDELWDFISTKW